MWGFRRKGHRRCWRWMMMNAKMKQKHKTWTGCSHPDGRSRRDEKTKLTWRMDENTSIIPIHLSFVNLSSKTIQSGWGGHLVRSALYSNGWPFENVTANSRRNSSTVCERQSILRKYIYSFWLALSVARTNKVCRKQSDADDSSRVVIIIERSLWTDTRIKYVDILLRAYYSCSSTARTTTRRRALTLLLKTQHTMRVIWLENKDHHHCHPNKCYISH